MNISKRTLDLDRAHRGHGRIEPCHCPCAAAAAGARRHQLHAGRYQGALRHRHGAHEGQAQPAVQKRQADLLAERYDLANRAATGVTMTRGKPVQEGVRVKLPAGTTWKQLAASTATRSASAACSPRVLAAAAPQSSRRRHAVPEVPHRRDQEAGGARPDALRPRLRPARPLPAGVPAADLPDDAAGPRRRLARASWSRSTTSTSCSTASSTRSSSKACGCWSRRSRSSSSTRPRTAAARSRSRGVACFDCHANGHTNAATHLVGDIRPQEFRHRIDTPSLRGVNIQRLFGSQRALKTRRGLHRVRAARRLLRRRSGDRHQEGREHPRARQPGPLHGRVPGAARLPAGAEARRLRQARSREGERGGAARRGAVLRQGPVRDLPPGAVLHRQPDAQPAGRALLQAAD